MNISQNNLLDDEYNINFNLMIKFIWLKRHIFFIFFLLTFIIFYTYTANKKNYYSANINLSIIDESITFTEDAESFDFNEFNKLNILNNKIDYQYLANRFHSLFMSDRHIKKNILNKYNIFDKNEIDYKKKLISEISKLKLIKPVLNKDNSNLYNEDISPYYRLSYVTNSIEDPIIFKKIILDIIKQFETLTIKTIKVEIESAIENKIIQKKAGLKILDEKWEKNFKRGLDDTKKRILFLEKELKIAQTTKSEESTIGFYSSITPTNNTNKDILIPYYFRGENPINQELQTLNNVYNEVLEDRQKYRLLFEKDRIEALEIIEDDILFQPSLEFDVFAALYKDKENLISNLRILNYDFENTKITKLGLSNIKYFVLACVTSIILSFIFIIVNYLRKEVLSTSP